MPCSSPECEGTWARVLSRLAQRVNKASFKTWLQNTSLMGIKEGITFVGVPNEFTRDWLERMFKGIVAKALSEVLGEEVELEFVVQKPDPALNIDFPSVSGALFLRQLNSLGLCW